MRTAAILIFWTGLAGGGAPAASALDKLVPDGDAVQVRVAPARPSLSPVPPAIKPCRDGATGPDAARGIVSAEARRQEADEKLALAILDVESGAGAHVNSPAGARGIMQLMPETAQRYGVPDVCDPVENARGAVSHLKSLSGRFKGNVFLVAAAYNAGETRVADARGIPAISETVRYVARVANIYFDLESVAVSGGSRVRAGPPAAARAGGGEAGGGLNWIGGSVLYVGGEDK